MKYIATPEKWKQLGQPDLGSVFYLRKRETSEKNFFEVVAIDYGNKKGIAMSLMKITKKRYYRHITPKPKFNL